jgi:hypothetical protein
MAGLQAQIAEYLENVQDPGKQGTDDVIHGSGT